MSKSTRINFFLTDSERTALKIMGVLTNQSMSHIIRIAIIQYLKILRERHGEKTGRQISEMGQTIDTATDRYNEKDKSQK